MKHIRDWVFMAVMGYSALANASEFHFHANATEEMMSFVENYSNYSQSAAAAYNPLYVGLTLIHGAAAKGAVCLDGSLHGYHLHRGFGAGANSWLVVLEGGGWCNNIRTCVYRKTTRRGSSKYFEKFLHFLGILSNRAEENLDFFNWNRVKIRYSDGASFTGDSQDLARGLQFRGQKMWLAAMEELMTGDVSQLHINQNFSGEYVFFARGESVQITHKGTATIGVSSFEKYQQTVSTAKAEYVAVSACCSQVIQTYSFNSLDISTLMQPHSSFKPKHIDVLVDFLKMIRFKD